LSPARKGTQHSVRKKRKKGAEAFPNDLQDGLNNRTKPLLGFSKLRPEEGPGKPRGHSASRGHKDGSRESKKKGFHCHQRIKTPKRELRRKHIREPKPKKKKKKKHPNHPKKKPKKKQNPKQKKKKKKKKKKPPQPHNHQKTPTKTQPKKEGERVVKEDAGFLSN